ncbi:hypothetical protein NP493_219g03005 [Ridgeia piscesae]|uniref:Uncharacterized protein n=1 Tax=Ridgeia piscesae TaxID=27915 RepID=A0AAD9P0H7_RIDPI|nr:hypothetical protein NP493_219g03005 [Ridgeia piscesae]
MRCIALILPGIARILPRINNTGVFRWTGPSLSRNVMSGGAVVGTDQVKGSLSQLSQGLEDILTNARKYVTESTETFVTQKVDVLAGAIDLYSDCYKSLNVTTKDDCEKLIGRHFKYADVQDGFEDLVKVEKDWAVFLEDVDRKLAASGIDKPLRVGDPGLGDVSLVDVRRDVPVTLAYYGGAGTLLIVLLRQFS